MKKLSFFLMAMLFSVMSFAQTTVTKTTTDLVTEHSWTVSAGSTIGTLATEFALDEVVTISTSGEANCGTIWLNSDKHNWRLYQAKAGDITIAVKAGYQLKTINLIYTVSNGGTLLDGTTVIASESDLDVTGLDSKTLVVGNTSDKTNGQVRITQFSVTYVATSGTTEPETPALAAPTFSIEAGKYTETKEVTLSAEAGTIYYTLDGTTPNAESEEYTTAIVLDECGATTIKAIAISGENTSSVASATYTIKLPIEAVSAEDPYTEAEAIEVYNGGCYDNQDVYVMGVVKTAQFYNSNTYTITLEGGFQFYKFYEAAGDVTFTEDYIVAGDTLVACGKLVKFGETYELGAGCYLVERKAYSLPKVDISNTPETAYTVAEAIALIDDITSDLTKQVYVKGEISEVESFNETYGSITYWIQDEEGNKFECYGGLGLDQEKFTSVEDLVVGSQVIVYGTLKKYGSIYEFNANNYLVEYVAPAPTTYTVTLLNDAGAELEGAGEYEEGSVATVIAPEMDGWYFVAWTDEEGMVISNDATTTVTVNQDITLTALYAMMMPLEVTDLEIVMDPVVGLIGSTDLGGGTLSLQLVVDASAEPGEDGEFPLTEESQIWLGEDTQLEFLEGVALIDLENNAAQAIVLAADDWGILYYFVIEMSAAAPAEPTEVVVENATVTIADATYGTVNVTAEWNGTLLKLEGIEKNAEGFLQITQVVDEATDDWYIWMAMNGTVTTVDNVLTVSGEFTNNWTGDVYNVTISGTLPAEEPEGPATGLDNINTTVAPVKAIVNGQLVIVKDGVKYNAQGAVL